jgi:RNA polymerase sigma factor (sigma-70 family)
MVHQSTANSAPSRCRFPTTQWTVVVRAGDRRQEGAGKALETLYETYWYPLFAYARRRGLSIEDAQDLTQAFFAHLLSGDFIARATPERGKFSVFLFSAFKYFLANAHHHAAASKRGGGMRMASLTDSGSRHQREPVDDDTPEVLYEREWAHTVIANTLGDLEREADRCGRRHQFEILRSLLTGDDMPYRTAGAQLGMTEGAVKVAVHRLRRRFAERLRSRIAESVTSPHAIEDEVRHLLTAITPTHL